jgi:hypothetical protein
MHTMPTKPQMDPAVMTVLFIRSSFVLARLLHLAFSLGIPQQDIVMRHPVRLIRVMS